MKREKKKQEGAKMVLPGWFASYADMVTVLMVFFILLFTMAQVDEEKFEELLRGFQGERFGRGTGESIFNEPTIFDNPDVPIDPPEPLPTPQIPGDPPIDLVEPSLGEIAAQMANTFRTYLAPYIVSDTPGQPGDVGIVIPEDGSYLRLIMYDRAHFESGQVTLMATATAMLDRMAPAILEYAEQGHLIVVEGHADSVPMAPGSPFVNNMGLSAMRATSVVNYLVGVWGVPSTSIRPTGMGEHHPIDTNDTPQGRANNRRVEIKIYTTVSTTTTRNVSPSPPFQIPGL
jgi:chemotaxis protein MotB